MGRRARQEALRRPLYRPGVDPVRVERYRSALRRRRVRLVAPVVAAAVALLAVGVVVGPRLLPPAPSPAALPIGPGTRGAVAGPERFADLAAAARGLPVPLATLSATGRDRVLLTLDRFGEVVEEDSRIVVLVRCRSGAFTLRLSSVTQGRSQILLEPLRTVRGRCGGVQRLRYRPLRGLLPTAVEVRAAGSVSVRASITGTP